MNYKTMKELLKVLDTPDHPYLPIMIDAVRGFGVDATDEAILDEYKILLKEKMKRD